MPTLRPPEVLDHLWTNDPLFSRYRQHRGVSLLVSGTAVTATQYPYQEDLDAYDHVYMGGHEYEISEAEAEILTDAGYGDYITP